ncbi:MAG: metallophosphoesterase [Kiritimatiellae bacterium]|nr:metallophosphoesterase [Kiritimatiellia bacterium]
MMVTRRSFVGGALAFGVVGGASGGLASPRAESGELKFVPPNLRFGVLSDIHIGGKKDAEATAERVLRWFASEGVDAVLCPGDIAHSGNIRELEAFADVWHKVFRGSGERVELMIATGNHDVDAWGGRWNGFTEEKMLAERFNYKDNLEKTWRRLFNQKWELIWRREVKGYTFVGAQWSSLNPPIGEYFRAHAEELRGAKPFFYCQHAHPKGTCHGAYSMGDDKGESVAALSPFPNAVALTGHSHCAISDERTVWQGAFTSIGAGCVHEGAGGFNYDNVTAYWHPSFRKKLMGSMADPQSFGGDAKGGGCEIVEVYDDHLVVRRQSVAFMRPIGPAWIVPIPARKGGPFDFAVREESRRAQGAVPQFAKDAKIAAEFCPKGHALEGVGRRGEPCIHVSFPRARTVKGSRVFDYTIEAVADGMPTPVVSKIVAAGFAYPEECADIPGECLFPAADLPRGRAIRITVTPRDCFGLAGNAIRRDCPPGALAG